MFEKDDSSNSQKMNSCSLTASVTARFELASVLTKEIAFLRFHFKANRMNIGSSKKTVLGIFKMALHFKDRHAFMWQSLEILNVFNTLILN